jgi:hypothetical protein
LEYAADNGFIDDAYSMELYFSNIHNITMSSIKQYYMIIMKKLSSESLLKINMALTGSQLPKFSAILKRTMSVDCVDNKIKPVNDSLSRLSSVDSFSKHNIQRPLSQASLPVGGCMVTTSDAHTLTDGPTIFIVEDVNKIGNFCIQQSKLPIHVFDQIMDKIEINSKKQVQIDILAKSLEDKIGEDSSKDKKVENDRFSPRSEIKSVALDAVYIPNTSRHQQLWSDGNISSSAFTSSIDDTTIREIMELNVENNFKLLLLMGIGVFSMDKDVRYIELMKQLAYEQKLYMVIATSDYIYGTNYNFCHGYLGKDLENMTQQKIIQSIGRIGRGNIQQEYTVRVRDNSIVRKLFLTPLVNIEARNMERIFY